MVVRTEHQPARFCLVRLRVNLCGGSDASEASTDVLREALAEELFLVAVR